MPVPLFRCVSSFIFYSGNLMSPYLEYSLIAGVNSAMLCGCCEAASKAARIKWLFMRQYLIAA